MGRAASGCLLGMLLSVGAARSARAGDVTCETAADHILDVMTTEGSLPDDEDIPGYRDSMRDSMLTECKGASQSELACIAAASSSVAIAQCEPPKPPAGPGLTVALPALSADGKTLALAAGLHVPGEWHAYVELVKLGDTSGDEMDLEAGYPNTMGDDPPVFAASRTEDHSAEVDAVLASRGFASLPFGNGAGEVDGITVSVKGGYTRKTLTFRAGKKKLGTMKLAVTNGDEVDVIQVVVVRGKRSWIYVASQEMENVELLHTAWHALEVKLPAAPVAYARPATPELVATGASGIRLGDAIFFSKPVEAAALDPAQDLLWFESGGTLEVLDLRDGAIVPIATKLPGGYGFMVSGVSTAESSAGIGAGFVPELSFAKKPKITDGGAGYPMMDAGMTKPEKRTFAKALKKTKVVGKKWLKAQLGRAPHAVTAPETTQRPDVTLPATTDPCDECGAAATFGDTPFEQVAIFDPATGGFLTPGKTGSWAQTPTAWSGDGGPFQFFGDGTTYCTTTALCTLGETQFCTHEDGWTYLGWWR